MKTNILFERILQKIKNCHKKLLKHIENQKRLRSLKCKIETISPFKKSTIIPSNTIAIIEPNPFHAETLPGYIKYFIDLGYNVDVFICIENAAEKPFALMPQKFRIFIGKEQNIQKWISYKNMADYSLIFFSSLIHNKTLRFMPSLVSKKCRNIIGIAHNIISYDQWLSQNNDYKKMKINKRVATLTTLTGYEFINPHYFGNITITDKNNNKTIFIAIGSVSRLNSSNLLITAVRQLKQNYNQQFEVHIIGNGSIDIPTDLQPYILQYGRLDFPSMYREIENADFILALLDSHVQQNLQYLNGTTSGSIQLSLGFQKPLIIESLFAKAYAFNNKDAIIYKDNELHLAMKYSIEMQPDQYTSIQQCILEKSEKIYNESIKAITRMTH